MGLPVVAIVGRPNVGKSSLLNALAGKLISIVQDMPGVTRDRISYPLAVPLEDDPNAEVRYVELLDTGGYGFVDETGLTEHIKHQIELAITRAHVVLFVVDTQAGLTIPDELIAKMLREKNLKVCLIANKADGDRADVALSDFARLGFGTPIGVSALNRRNLSAVYAMIRKNVDIKNAPTEVPVPEMMVAIVGKRNAGKSTLVNSIAREFEGEGAQGGDRVIVSEVPGTTRDSVDVRFEKDGHTLVVIDTAGVRKKRRMVTSDIDFYSFHRAERSIRRADVILLLIDANEEVSEPDKKLAAYIAEQMKPVVLVVNKWDLAKTEFIRQAHEQGTDPDDRNMMDQFREYLDKTLQHIDYAPIAFITAKEGKNIEQVLNLARHLHKQSSERVGTGRLNAAVQQVFQERTPTHHSGKRPKVYYATQTGTNPPELVLFVNNPTLIGETYKRFMINRFRALLPYAEVPMKLVIRGKAAADASRKPFKMPSARDAAEGTFITDETIFEGSPEKPVWDGNELGTSTLPPKGAEKVLRAPKPGKSLKRPSNAPRKDPRVKPATSAKPGEKIHTRNPPKPPKPAPKGPAKTPAKPAGKGPRRSAGHGPTTHKRR